MQPFLVFLTENSSQIVRFENWVDIKEKYDGAGSHYINGKFNRIYCIEKPKGIIWKRMNVSIIVYFCLVKYSISHNIFEFTSYKTVG